MQELRYQQIMRDLGLPNSRSLLGALQQVANEVAQEYSARIAELESSSFEVAVAEAAKENALDDLRETIAVRDLALKASHESLRQADARIAELEAEVMSLHEAIDSHDCAAIDAAMRSNGEGEP